MRASTLLPELPNPDSRVPNLVLMDWWENYGVVAGITGAAGGLDLARWGNRSPAEAERAWQAYQGSFESRFRSFAVGKQVHGTEVEVWSGLDDGLTVLEGVDGHATAERGTLLNVLVADCVPIYMLEPDSRSIALLHAGWRGTAAGVLPAGVERLAELSGAEASDFVMHCGVSICGECYEVGPEVIEAVSGVNASSPQKLDLRAALARHANDLGIERITVSPFCTLHDAGMFHSFRGQGQGSGRMAAYLGVPLA